MNAPETVSRDITLRLVDGDNLDRLLHGQFACFFWLSDNGDGTYGIHAGGVPATDESTIGEAFLRVCWEKSIVTGEAVEDVFRDDLPAVVTEEPREEVSRWMEKLRIRLGWNDVPCE